MLLISAKPAADKVISVGRQPQLSVDNKGLIRVVCGSNDSIFCSTSADNGNSFSKPALVGVVPKMHLGMARGPQLASSANYSVVTAMDDEGDIHFFTLKHRPGESWKEGGFVNDVRSSAPEGLMNIAADKNDNFYATWLDLREDRKNNIYFSSFKPSANKWAKNTLAYRSPDGHVCECCRPSIAVQGSKVAIMFRNWLSGSRDLYLARSVNGGRTFAPAEKLGSGTWKLNACPMDGGGLAFDAAGAINTTWRRGTSIYCAKPGEKETELAEGRDCSINTSGSQTLVAMTTKEGIKLKYVETGKELIIGKGGYLKTISLPGNKVLCVWEEDKVIRTRVI